jgi:hypothetical protein
VEIIKLRGTSHSQRIAPITISSEGINVFSGSFFNLKSKIQQPTIENSVKEIETQKQISYSSDNEEDILKKLMRKNID